MYAIIISLILSFAYGYDELIIKFVGDRIEIECNINSRVFWHVNSSSNRNSGIYDKTNYVDVSNIGEFTNEDIYVNLPNNNCRYFNNLILLDVKYEDSGIYSCGVYRDGKFTSYKTTLLTVINRNNSIDNDVEYIVNFMSLACPIPSSNDGSSYRSRWLYSTLSDGYNFVYLSVDDEIYSDDIKIGNYEDFRFPDGSKILTYNSNMNDNEYRLSILKSKMSGYYVCVVENDRIFKKYEYRVNICRCVG